MTIKSIGILATKAVTFDNEVKYYSNSKLFTELSITNYTRSDDLGDFVEFSPGDVTTTTIENGVKRYVLHKHKMFLPRFMYYEYYYLLL